MSILRTYSSYKIATAGALFCIGTFAIGLFSAPYFLGEKTQDPQIKLRDFAPNLPVDYAVYNDGTLIQEGTRQTSETGDLILPNIDAAHKNLDYQVKIGTNQSSAEALELLINMDVENGALGLSGKGLGAFSDILMTQGTQTQKMSADWVGNFSSDDISRNLGDRNANFQLAFQNVGFLNDVSPTHSGIIEVLGGDEFGSFSGTAEGGNFLMVRSRYTRALELMSIELSAVMVLQTKIIGKFFDASIQLNTQRKQQELRAEAHKDYHPSEQLCRIGTFVRSVAHTESKAKINKYALNRIMMNQYLGVVNSSASEGPMMHDASEAYEYISEHCDPRDFNGATGVMCDRTGAQTADQMAQRNKDINYANTLAIPLTIDVDFLDGDLGDNDPENDISNAEEDIIALAKNLYFPNVFEAPTESGIETDFNINEGDMRPHYDSRSFTAKMNVAHTSFLNIVGMKSTAPQGNSTTATTTTPQVPTFASGVTREVSVAGDTDSTTDTNNNDRFGRVPRDTASASPDLTANATIPTTISPAITTRPAPTVLAEDAGWAYMKALLREFGLTDEDGNGTIDNEIDNILGERPSYYAQMEVLTKKIYQSPDFYTNLYDKPANVARIGASLDAIALMHQRDRYESFLRREMLSALLLEDALELHAEEIGADIYDAMKKPQNQ